MSLNGEFDKFKARLSNLNLRARSYSRVFPWIFGDFLSIAWRDALGLLAIAGVSAGFRVAVVATLLGSIKEFAKPGSSTRSDGLIDVPYLGSIDYGLFGALILIFLALNAGISFLYERAVMRTAASYEPVVLKRSLEVYARLPNLHERLELPPSDQRNLLAAISRHARLITVFLRIILFSALGILSAIGCYIFLLVLNPVITMIFTFVIIIFLPVFYYLSLNGMRTRALVPIVVGEFMARLRALEHGLQSPVPPAREDSHRWIGNLVDGPIAHHAFEAFLQQRFIIFKAHLASGILTAIILAISITIFFASIRQDDALGGDFALFFALLFVMGMSLASSLNALVSGNRFFGTLKLFYGLLGPGSPKKRFSSADKGSSLAYESVDGKIVPLQSKCTVYLYIAGAKKRFDFQPVVNRLLPTFEPLAADDGSLILLDSIEDIDAYDRTGDQNLVFVEDKTGKMFGDARRRATMLERVYGTSPRFIVLKSPLDAKPKTKGQWLYVWGTPQRVMGDLAGGDKTLLPNAERLQKRLSEAGRKLRRGASIDVDEMNM